MSEHWQLEGSAPELYERYLVPTITAVWADDLVARAELQPGDRVLDIACGTGAVTRKVAERVTMGVFGLDLNAGMLGVARSLQTQGADRIEWHEGSALDLPLAAASFDLVLCQLGLQFFPDRPLALREMLRVLVPGGRLAVSVYSAIERTPAAHAFVDALDRRFGPEASRTKRAEHVFGDANEVCALIAQQGFSEVDARTVTKTISFPSVLDYVRFQLVVTPMAGLLSGLDGRERDEAVADVAAIAASLLPPAMTRDGRLSFPQEAHVALARKAG